MKFYVWDHDEKVPFWITWSEWDKYIHLIYRGRSRIFIWGGGGGLQKIICAHAHHEHEPRSPLWPGSRARLRALEALGFFFFMLSHAIWALFLSILIQNGIEKNIVDQILGGRAPVVPPSKSATDLSIYLSNLSFSLSVNLYLFNYLSIQPTTFLCQFVSLWQQPEGHTHYSLPLNTSHL